MSESILLLHPKLTNEHIDQQGVGPHLLDPSRGPVTLSLSRDKLSSLYGDVEALTSYDFVEKAVDDVRALFPYYDAEMRLASTDPSVTATSCYGRASALHRRLAPVSTLEAGILFRIRESTNKSHMYNYVSDPGAGSGHVVIENGRDGPLRGIIMPKTRSSKLTGDPRVDTPLKVALHQTDRASRMPGSSDPRVLWTEYKIAVDEHPGSIVLALANRAASNEIVDGIERSNGDLGASEILELLRGFPTMGSTVKPDFR